ncbi:CHAT domain-containing protein [Aquincola sp. S2]|uniref:CHAT domain-containing protein n=1 Tax=Pseudaquabacterium terrae TaxID=2732868 RepID=A0ABX2EB83_9BURK|nr:CHAT domain-containing protein [Aquabacterium terrae]NRF65821.1 CHAT domain-containing protein [Aquabacterium terrae]
MANQEITFVFSGRALPSGQASMRAAGTVRGAAQLGAQRSSGETVRLSARPGEDVVVLQIANGPALYLHPEDARALLLAQASAADGSKPVRGAAAGTAADEVAVPPQLAWPAAPGSAAAATRGGDGAGGLLGQVWVSGIEIVTGFTKDAAADLAAAAVTRKVDGQVETGLYRLDEHHLPRLKGSGRRIEQAPARAGNPPLLVLLHGTFVETTSTFGAWWAKHPQRVRALFERYGRDGVYAFDHKTLGDSPLANALALAQALPDGAKLHLVTHSRGGLVAEALVRACAEAAVGVQDDPFAAPGHAAHGRDLKALRKLVAERHLSVERVVRVACPARGTLLASKRLTAYLSVLKWGLELAQVPVAPELVDFLTEVARRREDPQKIPGLAAMIPDNPLVQWLTGPIEAVPSSLRVVAGDMEGDSIVSWLKTLASDAFYWTDNDLVVQTRSMYGGVPRRADGAAGSGASFLLDQGGSVSHFNYFSNERSVDAITRALLDDAPAGFATIGPLSWAGEHASGTRAARRSHADPSQVPAVFLLPGILGSNLKVDGKRVWLGWRFFNSLKSLDIRQPGGEVLPDGPIGVIYDKLAAYLSDSHEVHEFAYDWRVPLEQEARRLADEIAAALELRKASRQPVRIVAHSMGGLLARTMQLERPAVWRDMMARPDARLLMLGTPNGGSWAPMQVLSGDDTFGNTLVATGALFDDAGARKMMAQLPGFIQLQAALLDASPGLASREVWQALADEDFRMATQYNLWHSDERQLSVYRWGVPEQPVIDQAVALRKRLDAQLPQLAADAARMLLVVGHAKFTPAGIRTVEAGIEYLDAPERGDGRVTFASASLPQVRTWRVDASHGDLPRESDAFAGYLELLDKGDTRLLDSAGAPAGVRGAGAAPADEGAVRLQPARPARQATAGSGRPPSDVAAMFGTMPSQPVGAAGAAPEPALHVSVVNGDLRFISQPLLLGHYQSMKLSGAEYVVDQLLGGTMSQSLATGLYPTAPASHQVFVNRFGQPGDPFVLPRPEAVIIAGLGAEGQLRIRELCDTVRQATIAYAQRVAESAAAPTTGFELAATLIGSGGTGISAGSAARAVATGVREANARLARHGWPLVRELRLIELFLDRATEAHQALRMLASARAADFQLHPVVRQGSSPLRRPPGYGYRGSPYDLISVTQAASERAPLEFTLDSRSARNEVRGQRTQSSLVAEMIRAGASDTMRDARIGRTLFNLLVPLELTPFLGASTAVVLQVDARTAQVPWELLDTAGDDQASAADPRPWSVRTAMIRQLRTEVFREAPARASKEDAVLVIGSPKLTGGQFAPLPAAEREARAVAAALGAQPLIDRGALDIVNALMERPYRIVHIAGHGQLDDKDPTKTGVVLSGDAVLGQCEIEGMRQVPELAFINCCHLGAITSGGLAPPTLAHQQPLFAANVAEALIRIGVRCVIAAGWAVEDVAAQVFATAFYKALLGGERFVDAVGQAREAAWHASPAGNTWAAYQCYGDPDWSLTNGKAQAATTPAERLARYAIVSAPGLAIELEGIAVKARNESSAKRKDELQADVEQIEASFKTVWGRVGAVAEAFGVAYAETGNRDAAIAWYRAAVAAEDGSASLRAAEQLGNLLARQAERQADIAAARQQIGEAVALLEDLARLHPTSERLSLLGSAWKRLAMREEREGHAAQRRAAVEKMVKAYAEAERLAHDEAIEKVFYPAMNRMHGELILHRGEDAWPGFDPASVALVRQSLQAQLADPDFWSVTGGIELELYVAAAARALEAAWPGLVQRLTDTHARAPDAGKWDSVYAQARFVFGETPAAGIEADVVALLKKLAGK